MSGRSRAVLLVAVQLLIVVSIAAKYGYERKVCPRVWARTSSIDPNMPVRGRYLWLPVEVNACGLKPDGDYGWQVPNSPPNLRFRYWSASLAARDGHLLAYQKPGTPAYRTVHIEQRPNQTCDRAWIGEGIPFFVPDTAQSPYPLKKGEELWVEVTVPPAGPPRALNLAVSDGKKFTQLNLH